MSVNSQEPSLPAVHALHLVEVAARWNVTAAQLLAPFGLHAEALSAPVAAHHLVFPKAHSGFPRVRRFLQWMEGELGHGFVF